MPQAFRIAVALALVMAVTGCEDRDDLDGRRRPIPGLAERPKTRAMTLGPDRAIACDLYAQRPMVTLVHGGALVIPAGTAAFSAYTEGGYASPWHLSERVDGVPAAVFTGVAGALYFPLDGDAGGAYRAGEPLTISLRARSAVAGQLVSVFLNEHKLGDLAMAEPSWRTYSLTAPASTVENGENYLRFYFKSAGDIAGYRSAAALASVTVSSADKPPVAAALEAGPVARGGQILPSLAVKEGSRLSFFVRLPEAEPALRLAYAAAGAVTVAIATEGHPAEVVFAGKASTGWHDATIDLGHFSGQVARIDLLAEKQTWWGHPLLVAAAADAPAPATLADNVVMWAAEGLLPGQGWISGPHVTFTGARAPSSEPARGHAALLWGSVSGAGAGSHRSLPALFRDAGFVTVAVLAAGTSVPEKLAGDFDQVITVADARDAWGAVKKRITGKGAAHTFLYVAQPAGPGGRAPDKAGFATLTGGLEETGVGKRTAVILAGVPGTATLSLADGAVRVGLAMALPGDSASAKVTAAVPLVAVLPTALATAGIFPPPTLSTRSLMALAQGAAPAMPMPILGELSGRSRSLTLGAAKLVVPLSGPAQLYDLAGDPGEARNVARARPITLRRLRAVFGLATANRPWSYARWGSPSCPGPAFAADRGL